jgi:regulatory protein
MAWAKPKIREPLEVPALYEYAVGALARRMRTVAELRRMMQLRVEKGETGAVKIDAVIERLQAQRYLDDRTFAADYTRLRQEGAKFGRRRVQNDLQRKGVAGELVAETLEAAYAQVDELGLARQYLERKRVKKPGNEKESARVLRLLVRGGFSLPTAYKALRSWDVRDEALPPEAESEAGFEADIAGDFSADE